MGTYSKEPSIGWWETPLVIILFVGFMAAFCWAMLTMGEGRAPSPQESPTVHSVQATTTSEP